MNGWSRLPCPRAHCKPSHTSQNQPVGVCFCCKNENPAGLLDCCWVVPCQIPLKSRLVISIFMSSCSRDCRRHRSASRKNVARDAAAASVVPRNSARHRRLFRLVLCSIGVRNVVFMVPHNATLRLDRDRAHLYLRRAFNASTRASRLRVHCQSTADNLP